MAIFPNATHMIPFDDPALFNATVERLFRTPFVKRHRIKDCSSRSRKCEQARTLAANLAGDIIQAMSALFAEIQKQASMLTPKEKAALARLLIEELDSSSDADVEQLWIAESQRRYQAYLRGELQSGSGEEVMDRVRGRLK